MYGVSTGLNYASHQAHTILSTQYSILEYSNKMLTSVFGKTNGQRRLLDFLFEKILLIEEQNN
jgi:hypothetical protein